MMFHLKKLRYVITGVAAIVVGATIGGISGGLIGVTGGRLVGAALDTLSYLLAMKNRTHYLNPKLLHMCLILLGYTNREVGAALGAIEGRKYSGFLGAGFGWSLSNIIGTSMIHKYGIIAGIPLYLRATITGTAVGGAVGAKLGHTIGSILGGAVATRLGAQAGEVCGMFGAILTGIFGGIVGLFAGIFTCIFGHIALIDASLIEVEESLACLLFGGYVGASINGVCGAGLGCLIGLVGRVRLSSAVFAVSVLTGVPVTVVHAAVGGAVAGTLGVLFELGIKK